MKDFFSALVSQEKNRVIPEEFNYFGKLIGSWQIDYVESHHSRVIKDEWHFSWVLEGMAIQDVIILPDYEYGTSTILIRMHGMLLTVILEKLYVLKQENKMT